MLVKKELLSEPLQPGLSVDYLKLKAVRGEKTALCEVVRNVE